MIPNTLNVKIGADVTLQTVAETPSRTYKIDFTTGRVVGFCDGREAMQQAIFKILHTDRFAFRIYSWNYGMEWEPVLGKSYPVFESEIRRVIREALLADSRISDLVDFTVTKIDKRTASVRFVAETIFGDVAMETEVNLYV